MAQTDPIRQLIKVTAQSAVDDILGELAEEDSFLASMRDELGPDGLVDHQLDSQWEMIAEDADFELTTRYPLITLLQLQNIYNAPASLPGPRVRLLRITERYARLLLWAAGDSAND